MYAIKFYIQTDNARMFTSLPPFFRSLLQHRTEFFYRYPGEDHQYSENQLHGQVIVEDHKRAQSAEHALGGENQGASERSKMVQGIVLDEERDKSRPDGKIQDSYGLSSCFEIKNSIWHREAFPQDGKN